MSCKYTSLQNFVLLLGRICISLIFIIAGFDKIMSFSQTATLLAAKGLPYSELFLVIALIVELVGGLLILFGLYTRLGALILFLFMIPVTYVFHAFWLFDGFAMVNNMHHFFKNLTMMGAMLYIMAAGAGSISIDGIRLRHKHKS